MSVAPQKREGGQWKTELIMEGHIGENSTVDIDNDGEDERLPLTKNLWRYDSDL